MKTKEIVKIWLREKGYDGLVFPEMECGCTLEDFVPCCGMGEDCEAAFNRPDLCPESYKLETGFTAVSCWMVTKETHEKHPIKSDDVTRFEVNDEEDG